MKWWIALILVVVALLLFTVREGFEATDQIKNPSDWNTEEIERIRQMVEQSSSGMPIADMSDTEIRQYVGGFWSVWTAEQTQITESQITNYVSTIPPQKQAYVKQAIRKYYIEQGQSVFQAARGYIAERGTETYSFIDQMKKILETRSKEIEIQPPTLANQDLRALVKRAIGNQSAPNDKVDSIILNLINYYNEVYLPAKQLPTVNSMKTFADRTSLVSDADKAILQSVIQSYFSDPAFVRVPYVGDLYKTPSATDTELRSEVAISAGVSTSNSNIDKIIGELIKFHGSLSSKTTAPTPSELTTFVESSTLEAKYKPTLKSLIEWYYEKPSNLNTGISGGASTSVDTTGYASTYQPGGGPAGLEANQKGKNIWGPAFTGFGTPIYDREAAGEGGINYPTIAGPDQIQPKKAEESAFGRAFVPSSASLGSLELSKFLPYSRENAKDIGLLVDPYRTANTYSTSSYSSKREPIPFLSDFSAFMK